MDKTKRMNPIIPENQTLPILQLQHHCDLCRTGTRCCCASFDVCITEDEVKRIDGVMPEVTRFVPRLVDEDGAYENVFEETDDGYYAIDTHEDGLCVFAYQREGETRCAIHSAALETGLPVESVKPQVCLLWPLAVSEDQPPWIGVDTAAYHFHCNRQNTSEVLTLDPAIRDTLVTLFGEETLAKMPRIAHNTFLPTDLSEGG